MIRFRGIVKNTKSYFGELPRKKRTGTDLIKLLNCKTKKKKEGAQHMNQG